MDYLTVKEVAELKGCSEQYIRTQIQNGKIKAEKTTNASNGHESYLVSVSSLSEDLQAKYYNKLKKEVGTAPELKETEVLKQHKNTVKKRFEEYSQAERVEIALWCNILREWQELRIKYKNKASFDSDFIGKCRIEYEGINISIDILYRKYAAFRENDYECLIDKRGGWNRGQTSMNEDVWKMFTRIYLVFSRPTVSRCYRDARVSTDSEEQQTSYAAQVSYYTNYIQNRADWEFVSVYTDEGISATNTKHRDGFNAMIADALDGKIDLIVTKSVSRFARNTVDSLITVRKLKDKGIEVYFEKENSAMRF